MRQSIFPFSVIGNATWTSDLPLPMLDSVLELSNVDVSVLVSELPLPLSGPIDELADVFFPVLGRLFAIFVIWHAILPVAFVSQA